MRSDSFLIALSALILTFACNVSGQNINNAGTHGIIDSGLLSEINNFISIIDTLPGRWDKENVILVRLEKRRRDLFVKIQTCYFYPNKYDGYYINGEFLIIFYNIKYWPSKGITNYLSKDSITDNFISEDKAHLTPYEPAYMTYKLVKNEKLDLINKDLKLLR